VERDGTGEKKEGEERCRPEMRGARNETHREEEYAKRGKNSAGELSA
jgi:hypothetical protein